MKILKFMLLGLLVMIVGCGGGKSDSGAGQREKNVSSCISIRTEPSSLGNIELIIFKNNCELQVNLGTVSIGITLRGPFVLNKDEEHESILVSKTEFIACKPPSVPIDKDSSPTKVELECS